MRIIIEIDGLEMALKAKQPQVTTEVHRIESSIAPQTAALTTPPSLLKTAAALEAENAGPAPSDLSNLTRTELPITMAYSSVSLQETGAMDAGSAPAGANESTSETKKKGKGK